MDKDLKQTKYLGCLMSFEGPILNLYQDVENNLNYYFHHFIDYQ